MSVRVLDLHNDEIIPLIEKRLGPFLIRDHIVPEDHPHDDEASLGESGRKKAIFHLSGSMSNLESFCTSDEDNDFDFDPGVYDTTEIYSSSSEEENNDYSPPDDCGLYAEDGRANRHKKDAVLLGCYGHDNSCTEWTKDDQCLIDVLHHNETSTTTLRSSVSLTRKTDGKSIKPLDEYGRQECLAIIFVPPSAHVLFKFRIAMTSTLVEIVTSEYGVRFRSYLASYWFLLFAQASTSRIY